MILQIVFMLDCFVFGMLFGAWIIQRDIENICKKALISSLRKHGINL
jgi:uncharacterized protein YneF (UPF0154 family)